MNVCVFPTTDVLEARWNEQGVAQNSEDRLGSLFVSSQDHGVARREESCMSRAAGLRWRGLVGAFLLLLAAGSSTGCAYVVTLGYLLGGPPSIEPDFDKMTKKSLTDKGVKVAVVVFCPDEIRWNYTDADKDIAKFIAFRLHEHHVSVINPDRVQEWLDQHEDWDRPEEVGQATGATHVVVVDVHKYNLYEENSHELFRGRAEVMVAVHHMNKDGDADKIYMKELTSLYPLQTPRSASDLSYDRFRKQYLSRLSEEIGRLFYEYYNGDDISDVI
jgi:hypothetical protein